MKQTTKNLIRGVGVAAAIALPLSVGPLAVGISKAFGHPLLEEGKPKVMAQLAVPESAEPKNKTPFKPKESFTTVLNGTETLKEKAWYNTPIGSAVFVFAVMATLLGIGAALCSTVFHPAKTWSGRNPKPKGDSI